MNFYPSGNLFADFPATQSQNRQLLNWGVRADITTTKGRHTLKYGIDLKQTRLLENFSFDVTNPGFNSPCIDNNGASVPDATLTDPAQCEAAGYQPNTPDNPNASVPFAPGLLPYDLTRGGTLFTFHGTGNINQYAFFIQDEIKLGRFIITPGFRFDVLRAAYARTFETQFNENLLLSSATGAGGLAQNLFGSTSVPIAPGNRNQFISGNIRTTPTISARC